MKKFFYSHLISDEPLQFELEALDLEDYEREELRNMFSDTVHHGILEAILDELSEGDKQLFLEHMAHDNHDKVWEHLRSKITNIESKIKSTADTMMDELYEDIKQVKSEED